MRIATMSAISPEPSSSRTTSQCSVLSSAIARYWIDSLSLSFVWDSTLKFVSVQSSGMSWLVSKGGLSQVGLIDQVTLDDAVLVEDEDQAVLVQPFAQWLLRP